MNRPTRVLLLMLGLLVLVMLVAARGPRAAYLSYGTVLSAGQEGIRAARGFRRLVVERVLGRRIAVVRVVVDWLIVSVPFHLSITSSPNTASG